jgi:hypothetical protein
MPAKFVGSVVVVVSDPCRVVKFSVIIPCFLVQGVRQYERPISCLNRCIHLSQAP